MKNLTWDNFFIRSESVFHWVVCWNWVNPKSPAVLLIRQEWLYLAVGSEVSHGGAPLQSWAPGVLLWLDLGQRPPQVPMVWATIPSLPGSRQAVLGGIWGLELHHPSQHCTTLEPGPGTVLGIPSPAAHGRAVLCCGDMMAVQRANLCPVTYREARTLWGGWSLFPCLDP